tara:strand:+ start:36 stop:599 length:564 start_codon:yes stop_codon:yes gene_type:complete
MKKIIIIFIFKIVFISNSNSSTMLIDDFFFSQNSSSEKKWSLITDKVMGGISEGKVKRDKISGKDCYRLQGNVSTKNNGGFIQIRTLFEPSIELNKFKGIYAQVLGNNKRYFFHIRTKYTLAPWQFYSYSFEAQNKWTEIKIPFSDFKKSNFYQPKKLRNQKIKSIGLVAGFENYKADICLGEIGFY